MTPRPPHSDDPHVQRACALDAELAKASRGIRVLEHLAWPVASEETFLSGWRAGRRELPAVRLDPVENGQAVERLDAIAAECDPAHPLASTVDKTARSYAAAARMLGGIGTPDSRAGRSSSTAGRTTPTGRRTGPGSTPPSSSCKRRTS